MRCGPLSVYDASPPLAFDISTAMNPDASLPWYREISKPQWKVFLATFFGWLLDGFDFTIMTFVLIDIQNSFAVDRALAGGTRYGDIALSTCGWTGRWYGCRSVGT